MNKRGQFFLIAAFVIILILFGLSAIYTTVQTTSTDTAVYDLTKEIKYEANVVIDSGTFNALTEEQKNKNVQNLTDYYASANLGTDFIVIFGNQTSMTALFYKTEDTGSIGIDLGTGPSVASYAGDLRKYNSTFQLGTDNEVTIILDKDQDQEISYTFTVKPGQMFFLILKKERQGEQFVSATKEE